MRSELTPLAASKAQAPMTGCTTLTARASAAPRLAPSPLPPASLVLPALVCRLPQLMSCSELKVAAWAVPVVWPVGGWRRGVLVQTGH